MHLSLEYEELSTLISAKLGLDVSFSRVDERCLYTRINVKVTIPFLNKKAEKAIDVKLSNFEIDGDDLSLHYDAGKILNAMSSNLTSFLPLSVIEDGIVEIDNNSQIVIHLAKIEKVHQALQYIVIESIKFAEQVAVLDFTLRG